MRSLGTTIANLARQRRRWETLLRSMPRTQLRERDFDPPFDRLTEVMGFGSNPGSLRMFEYVPADPQPAEPLSAHQCDRLKPVYSYQMLQRNMVGPNSHQFVNAIVAM